MITLTPDQSNICCAAWLRDMLRMHPADYLFAAAIGIALLARGELKSPRQLKVQRQVLQLRRDGRLPYDWITDSTRWMQKPDSFNGPADAIDTVAALYRKNLWNDANTLVEIWVEKESVAGLVYPVTAKFDVPLFPCGGFCSETFAYNSVDAHRGHGRPVWVYYIGDFDRAGVHAAMSLEEKLLRFAGDFGVDMNFYQLALNQSQVQVHSLSTRPPKRKTAADKNWPHSFCCEVEAMNPTMLRSIVNDAIELHMPEHQYTVLKAIEEDEKRLVKGLAGLDIDTLRVAVSDKGEEA